MTTVDYTKLREHIQSGGLFRDFPLEDCTCGVCGTGGCLLYPDPRPRDEWGSATEHRPSLVCPKCSTRLSEEVMRACAIANGFALKPVTVFAVGDFFMGASA